MADNQMPTIKKTIQAFLLLLLQKGYFLFHVVGVN